MTYMVKRSLVHSQIITQASHIDAPIRDNGINILGYLDMRRIEVVRRLNSEKRWLLGQFLTPPKVARLMASMLDIQELQEVRLLDPGAGIGTLFAACVERWCSFGTHPKRIAITAYEIEPAFQSCLEDTVRLCRLVCQAQGIEFEASILPQDFISSATSMLRRDLFSSAPLMFSHAILNPPYHKIQSDSDVRKMLRTCGIETSNLYTAFLALTSMLLTEDGQLVSITPRSFCNGLYFKPFRKQFLKLMNIERLHLFHSRKEAFKEDEVLQENVVMSTTKGRRRSCKVIISSSFGVDDEIRARETEPREVVSPNDGDAIIHIVTDELEDRIGALAASISHPLASLGLEVSTGRVVDFRAEKFITFEPTQGTVPLIYPAHFNKGFIRWPINGSKKPNGLLATPETIELLVPAGNYVLVKRFSSKEERKRVVAAVYDPSRIQADKVGFENHLNYFHMSNEGLDLDVAKGLAAFLNSTFVDTAFRQFSGHTQVNAVDLRRLKYPSLEELRALGECIGEEFPEQEELDKLIEGRLLA